MKTPLLDSPVLVALDPSSTGLVGLVPAGLLVLGGLMLWLAGGRLLKSGVVLIGLAIGGLIGLLMGGLLGGSAVVAAMAGLIGALAGGLAGWMFFRAATAICFGLAIGMGAAVVGLAISGALGGKPAAMVALAEPDPAPDPEDQPTGLGGSEQPVVAPPERPRLPDEPVMDPGPNPAESDEPATAPNPRTVDPARGVQPKKPVAPKAPAKAPDRREPSKSEPKGSSPERGAANRLNARPTGKASGASDGKPQAKGPAGGASMRTTARAGGAGAGVGTLGFIDVDAPAEAAEQIGAGARQLGGTLTRWWRGAPSIAKAWVVGLGLLGAAAGVLAGLFMPGKAASVLTSAAGAALWPAGVLMLAEALGWKWPTFGMMPPLAWVMAWLVLTFVGVALQASGGKGKASSTGAKAAKKATKG